MRLRLSFLALGLVALLAAGTANAASITYYLDQTNIDDYLADGTTNYLEVILANNGDDIDVTVNILTPLDDIKDANFGIQSFLFNSKNMLTPANIDLSGLPVTWDAKVDLPGPPPLNGDGFGAFAVEVFDGGQNRLDPTLSFSIIDVADDQPSDYVVLSTDYATEGNSYFAAHVTAFLDQDPGDGLVTSGWFGVPEPSTALLLLGGLSGLVVWRRRLH